jgi:hypothetical protein
MIWRMASRGCLAAFATGRIAAVEFVQQGLQAGQIVAHGQVGHAVAGALAQLGRVEIFALYRL